MAKNSAPAEASAPAPRKKSRLLFGIALAVVILAGGGVAAYYVLAPQRGQNGEPASARADAAVTSYFAFEQAFTCNLAGSSRLMQVKISISTNGPPAVFEVVRQHDAPLRAAMLAVLMEQALADVTSRSGKQALSRELRAVINAELEQRGGNATIAEVFFTDLIIQ